MARRTRRPRVVWATPTDEFALDGQVNSLSTYSTFVHDLVAVNPGVHTGSIVPVIKDKSADPIEPTNTLADLYNSGYRLRRIVGKIWLAAEQSGEATPPAAICTAGFMILRTDALGEPLNVDTDAYFPNIIDTAPDPWIWRRSWIVANHTSSRGSTGGFETPSVARVGGPNNNYGVGGNMDGPHVDAKTARIVGPDERLFLICSTTAIASGNADIPLTVQWLTDLRVLLSLKTNLGNRNNASR